MATELTVQSERAFQVWRRFGFAAMLDANSSARNNLISSSTTSLKAANPSASEKVAGDGIRMSV
jgi:hypothetical protein